MKKPDDFGNPNRAALHPAFRSKTSIRPTLKRLQMLNSDYLDSPVRQVPIEEHNVKEETKTL
jgi:hypothetical protein